MIDVAYIRVVSRVRCEAESAGLGILGLDSLGSFLRVRCLRFEAHRLPD